MAQVLYRKYRSQTFAQIYGQSWIVRILKQAISDNKVAHAYLFTGPRGTGKTSMARILAKALNCKDIKQGEPCNECSACISINENKFLDLIEIDAASNRGIDEIRALKEKVGFLPAEGKYKVYIIDEVHMLTMEAFNALLKTLEEPPERVIFILATTESHKLPLTIISRTQRFDFKLAENEELVSKLRFILEGEGVRFEDDALQLIVNGGNGSFRDAETILEKVISSRAYTEDKEINKADVEKILGYADTELVDKVFTSLSQNNLKQALSMLSEVEKKGINLTQLIRQLLEKARIEMTAIVKGEKSDYQMSFLTKLITEFSKAADELKRSLVPMLPLELAAVNVVQLSSINNQNEVANVVSNTPKPIVEKGKKVTKEFSIEGPKETEEKGVIQEEVVPEPDEAEIGSITLEVVKANWSRVLEGAKAKNHHLTAFLSKAEIKGIENNMLLLDVPFSFHKKSLEQVRTQNIFSEVTMAVFGSNLKLKCDINKDMGETESSNDANSDLVESVFIE